MGNNKNYLVWGIGILFFIMFPIVAGYSVVLFDGEWFVFLGLYVFFFHWVVNILLGKNITLPYGGEELIAGSNSVIRTIVFLLSLSMCGAVMVAVVNQ